MKRIHLLRRIGRAARAKGLDWSLIRQGSEHEVWDLEGVRVIIPRHREINEVTAVNILKVLQEKLR